MRALVSGALRALAAHCGGMMRGEPLAARACAALASLLNLICGEAEASGAALGVSARDVAAHCRAEVKALLGAKAERGCLALAIGPSRLRALLLAS